MKKTFLYLLITVGIFLHSLPIGVSAENNILADITDVSRNVAISGTIENNKGMNINVLYPETENKTLSSLNISDMLVYTDYTLSDGNGNFSFNFKLPEDAPFGTYFVDAVSEDGNKYQTTFTYAEYVPKVIFEEKFNNTILWNCNNMLVKNGSLVSQSDGVCSATIKGDNGAFFKNAEYNIKFSFGDDNNGWFKFIFQNDGINAERLLIYKNRICRYLPNQTVTEEHLSNISLVNDKVYDLRILMIDNTVSYVIKDDDGQLLTQGRYTSDISTYGKFGFETFHRVINVHEFTVKSVEDTNLFFNKKPISLEVSESSKLNVTNNTGNELTYEVADSSIASVSGDVITGVSNGTTYVTVSDGVVSDKCSITVYTDITKISLSKNELTLYPGENISVNTVVTPSSADASGLIWTSSDENIVSLFGSVYTTRTLCALSEGVAQIKLQSGDGVIYDVCNVRVMPKDAAGVKYASFVQNGSSDIIKDNVFGITANKFESDNNTYTLIDEMGFNIIRSFGVDKGEHYNESYFDFANRFGVPNMVVLPFYNQEVSEIVSQIGSVIESLDNNSIVYAEFGNELYDGAAGMTSAQFVDKCKEAYTAIKNAYPQVKIGVPFYSMLGNSEWNNALLTAKDYYDAIILHNYNALFDINGKTQNQMMQYLYSSNLYQEKIISKYKNLAPEKEIWISEYGNLIVSLFNQNIESEKARMQFAKTSGVALTNMEMLLNMLSDPNVDMASYHFPNDAQGFGIIQGTVKLPNYYTFKKVSELLSVCNRSYEIDSVQNEKFHIIGSMVNDANSSNDCRVDKVGAWGFGTDYGMEYVIFSNRMPNQAKISLNGKSLKPVWSYGGDENILGDYLANSLSYVSAPNVIPQPTEYDGEFENEILLEGYSIVVCEVIDDTDYISISCNVETDFGAWDFNSNGGLAVALGSEISLDEDDITLTKNNVSVGCTVESVGGNSYQILPIDGFAYDTEYELIVLGKRFAFKTCEEPFYERFSRDIYDDFGGWFLSNNWTYAYNYFKVDSGSLSKYKEGYEKCSLSNKVYDDFVMTFDAILPQSEHLTVSFREGYIRIFSDGLIFSYTFNGKNDQLIGKIDIPADRKVSFKIVAFEDKIHIYSKNTGDSYYTYSGCINYVNNAKAGISFGGNGIYMIDNFEIKTNKTLFEDYKLYQRISSEEILLDALTKGTNLLDVTLSQSVPNEITLIGALYDDNKLMSTYIPLDITNLNHTFEIDVNSPIHKAFKVFLWDGLNTLTPLDEQLVLN